MNTIFRARTLILVSLLLSLFILDQSGLPPQQAHAQTSPNGITYIYDELGRLVGVVDPVGNSAMYRYDAVGNILSISRQNSGSVSIIEFTPNYGPAGTQVIVYGTGFSATASQNTVKFNGVVASVTSATPTQLVTKVPSGAATGPINVTTPTGSATRPPFQKFLG